MNELQTGLPKQGLPEVKSSNQYVITGDTNPEAVRALYREIVERTDRLGKNYRKRLIVNPQDLEQLHYKIIQTIVSHRGIESSEDIQLRLHNEERVRYSSFEKSKSFNVNSPCPTSYIRAEWRFLKQSGTSSKLEEYKVTVIIDGLIIDQRVTSDPITEIKRVFRPPPVSVFIDYPDYIVARSLMQAVDEWVEGLEGKSTSKFYEFMAQYEIDIETLAPMFIVACVLMTIGLTNKLPLLASTSNVIQWLVSTGVALILSYILAGLIVRWTYSRLGLFDDYAIILFNKGDDKNKQELDKIKRRNPVQVGLAVLLFLIQVLVTTLLKSAYTAFFHLP